MGEALGNVVGTSVCATVGGFVRLVGDVVGDAVGLAVGLYVCLGREDGRMVGGSLVISEGNLVGIAEGVKLSHSDGDPEGVIEDIITPGPMPPLRSFCLSV